MNKKVLYGVIALLCVLTCFYFYSYMRMKELYTDAVLTSAAGFSSERDIPSAAEMETELVTFYICGEVMNPEVYTLPKGSRIIDAIEAAGGKTAQANTEMMASVAGIIEDGQKIYVPNVDDDIDKINYMNNNSNSASQRPYIEKDADIVVNINTAEVSELSKIPGIGEVTAKTIYDYRQENGDFLVIEDIKNVPRIGDKTFENIKKNITVEAPEEEAE